MKKVCSKCNIEKSFDSYCKNKNFKDGLYPQCKDCKKEADKKYYQTNKLKIKEYYSKSEIKLRRKEYDRKFINRLKQKEYKKKYRNKYEVILKEKEYRSSLEAKLKRNIREKKRKQNDPIYKFLCNQRNRLYYAFKSGKYNKSKTTLQYLGCTSKFLYDYIMSKLKDGMTFENYGRLWEIDHFEPLSPEDRMLTQKELEDRFHYSNLRPITIKENRIKKNKELKV